MEVEEHYQVVGSQEADPMNGRISEDSPFGKALLGKAIGDDRYRGGPRRQHRIPRGEISSGKTPPVREKRSRRTMSDQTNQQQPVQTEPSLSELLQIRRDKLTELQKAGKDPFARSPGMT